MTGDDAYYSDSEFQEMLADYEHAQATGEPVFMDADDLCEIADYYQSHDRIDEARQVMERAAELQPDAVGVLSYQIREALLKGDTALARQYLDRIIDRELPEYIYCRAEILIAEDKADEADLYLRECLKSVPPDEYQDFVVDVANIYADYDMGDMAQQWLLRAKHEDSDDFKELVARTKFCNGDYKGSADLFNELIDRNPFEKHYWNALASAQYMTEDYHGALSSSEYAIAIDPADAEALMAKAGTLYRLDNFEESLKFYERYTELVPDDELGYIYQGTCLINLGRNEEATRILHQGLERAPKDSPYLVELYQEMAFAYSQMGRPDTAINYLDKTDTLDCDHVEMQVVKGHVLLANHDLAGAEQAFKKAMSDTTDVSHTMLRVAISLYDNNYVDAAYRMLSAFYKAFDQDQPTEGYPYMALFCWDLQRYDEFLDYLEHAVKNNPQETRQALAHLFPEDMPVDEYYSYMTEHLKQ